jgi:hypothetical protein
MKYLNLISIVLSFILCSCGPSKKEKETAICLAIEDSIRCSILVQLQHSFYAPYPKRNINLSRILGDSFQIYGKCCPMTYRVLSTRGNNLIIDTRTDDTIFKGTVCRHRGLYYLSEKIDKSLYRIFALRITDSFIYGILNYNQYRQIDSAISLGGYPKLVKFTDKNKQLIRLYPDKKELRRMFTNIIDNTQPFKFIKPVKSVEEDLSKTPDPDDFEIISKVYPNPVKDKLHVDLYQNAGLTPYLLSDMNGKILMQGQLRDLSNIIDISHLKNGIYNLSIITGEQQKETLRLIKTN